MTDQPRTVEDVRAIVEEHQLRFIRFWFTDILGQLKSFSINSGELDEAFAADGASLNMSAPTLGEILVNEGLASKDQVLDALNAQQHQPDPKTPLGEILLQAKAITERALDQAPVGLVFRDLLRRTIAAR